MSDAALSTATGTARQGEIYVGGMLHQRKQIVPTRQDALEAAAEAAMSPRSVRLYRWRSGAGGDDARQPGRVRCRADQAAHAA